MFINRYNVLHHLLRLRVLGLSALVDGTLEVREASRRNRAFMVRRPDGGGWFVKQQGEPATGRRLDMEAACYALAGEHHALREAMPARVAFDTQAQVLVVELIAPAESLLRFHRRTRRFPPPLGYRLGAALGQCHAEIGKTLRFGAAALPLQRELPWILRPGQLDRFGSLEQSAAQAKVVDLAQRVPELAAHLQRLAAAWQANGVIHGDAKCDNALVAADEQRIALVDWEMADAGALSWDVGGLLQSYLWQWISAMPLTPGMAMDEAVAAATIDIDALRPLLAALWRGYLDALQPPPSRHRQLAQAAIEHAGARMLQTAFEALEGDALLEARCVLLLQSAANLMAAPGEASEWLLEAA